MRVFSSYLKFNFANFSKADLKSSLKGVGDQLGKSPVIDCHFEVSSNLLFLMSMKTNF
jgi:hypothetical protein